MRMMFAAALLSIVGLLTCAPVIAQDKPAAPAPPSSADVHVFNFGKQNLACMSWTDGCRTCVRQGEDGAACSNIGTACQPGPIVCVTPQEQKRDGEAPK